ncbi:MAG: efflux RND transporter permease subunit [Psychrobium sp.]
MKKLSFNQRLAQLVIHWAIHWPKAIYALVALIALALLTQVPRINIDTDPQNMLSHDNPARVFHQQVKKEFNLYDAIVLGVVNQQGIYTPQSLSTIKNISDYLMTVDGVIHSEVMAPSLVDNIVNEAQGALRFSWLMPSAPQSQQQADAIQQAINRLPMLKNTLASNDHQAIAIYIPLKNSDNSYQIAQQLRQFISTQDQNNEYFITGLPIAENQFGNEMFVQMAISAPLAGLMIFTMLWLFLRKAVVTMGAMLVAMSTVIITMGSLIALGFSVHILSSMIAIFLMPIAVVDAIHVLSEFKEKLQFNRANNISQSTEEAISDVISHLFQPMLFTTLTSAIGFYSLMLTPIPPVKVFGGFVGSGIIAAFILTMTLLPAYLSRLSPSTINDLSVQDSDKPTLLVRGLLALSTITIKANKSIIMSLVAITVIGLMGITHIVINDNPVRWFKSDHQISISDRVLNHHFSGTYNAYLVLSYDEQGQQQYGLIDSLLGKANSEKIVLPNWLARPTAQQLLQAFDDASFEQELNTQQQSFLTHAQSVLNTAVQTQGNFYQPDALNTIEQLAQHLRQSSVVGKVNTLSDITKTVNRELVSGLDTDYVLPKTSDGVAQVLLQYQSSHRPGDLNHFVTPAKDKSLLWLQLNSGDNQAMMDVIDSVDAYLADNPLPLGMSLNWAGKAYINVIWQQAMVEGMLESLLSAFVLVLLMMIMLFRSIRYGLLAMLPLSITIISIYGVIGWIGKDYDMPIAVLSSLTLGLSVDFAIHFIERYRTFRKNGQTVTQAITSMFHEPARAISRNAIVIALGFTPLLFAPLVPYVTVGLFLASIMLLSAFVTLTLIPAVLSATSTEKS